MQIFKYLTSKIGGGVNGKKKMRIFYCTQLVCYASSHNLNFYYLISQFCQLLTGFSLLFWTKFLEQRDSGLLGFTSSQLECARDVIFFSLLAYGWVTVTKWPETAGIWCLYSFFDMYHFLIINCLQTVWFFSDEVGSNYYRLSGRHRSWKVVSADYWGQNLAFDAA